MTNGRASVPGLRSLPNHEKSPMKFDLFKDAAWRKKISEPASDGTVRVQLSSGKTVTMDSQLLAVLRLLVQELATKDETRH